MKQNIFLAAHALGFKKHPNSGVTWDNFRLGSPLADSPLAPPETSAALSRALVTYFFNVNHFFARHYLLAPPQAFFGPYDFLSVDPHYVGLCYTP